MAGSPLFNSRFLRREARAGARQLALYIVCVWCAVMAVATVGGWRLSVDTAMATDARETAGGDIVAFSTLEFSPALAQGLLPYKGLRTAEMFTVVLSPGREGTLFCKLKAVEEGYPLYGKVPLASGGDLHEALRRGVVVEQKVLDRMGLHIGDRLKVGERIFPIVDVSLSEPDRPLGVFGVSPRVFVAYRDLESLGLVGAASYVERRVHIFMPDSARASEVAAALRELAIPDQERVETWQRPSVNMRRFVDNFFTFLDMMAVFAVALGGLGMQGTLTAWLRERRPTIAIVRTLGANARFVISHYALIATLATFPGMALGLLSSALALRLSGSWLATLLPVRVAPYLPLEAALQSLLLGLLISAGFTALPLLRLREVRPATVLRREEVVMSRGASWGLAAMLLSTTCLLLWGLLHSFLSALLFTLGLAGILGVVLLLSQAGLTLLKGWRPRRLDLRTGQRGLQAPGSASRAVIVIMATSLAVLFTVGLVERALDAAWVEALPADAPNIVFMDIQPDQQARFAELVGARVKLYPSIRARIRDVDGRPLPRLTTREYWDRDARREFRCSARDSLDEDEELAAGKALFDGGGDDAQVSASDRAAAMAGLKVGSKVTFTVQGVPMQARVSSIRHELRQTFRPTFDFIFPPALVAEAPQTIFCAVRLEESRVAAVQTRVALAFPNITSMDVSQTIRLVALKVGQMIGLIRFFMLGGALAGLVILISAALSTRLARMRESAYYKVLGATRGFVSSVLLWENAVLGLLCSGLALGLSLCITWGLCRWKLDVPFPLLPGMWAAMLAVPTAMITGLGWAVSRPVVEARPAPFLREDA